MQEQNYSVIKIGILTKDPEQKYKIWMGNESRRTNKKLREQTKELRTEKTHKDTMKWKDKEKNQTNKQKKNPQQTCLTI